MRDYRKFIIFSSVLILSAIFSVSLTAKTGIPLTEINEKAFIPKGALLEDIDHLVGTIEKAHADPYRLTSREDFLNLISSRKDYVRTYPQAELSLFESFYILQELAAAIFKHSKMGTVIGQETAGRIKFNSDPVAVKLPNSGLRVYIPVAIYALPGDKPAQGVIPDVVTDYSIEDLKKHTDKEIAKTKELLTKMN